MPRLALIKRRLAGWREHGEVHTGLDLRSAIAPQSEWINVKFVGCKMGLSVFRGSKFIGCLFIQCHLDMADFSGCTIVSTDFDRCSLEQASFAASDLKDVAFHTDRLAYASFQGSTTRGSVSFSDCNFHGADLDFLECDKGTPQFDGCNLWGARMAMGCAFWGGSVDLVTAQRFAAMLCRMHQHPALAEFAGDQVAVVARLMGGDDVG